MLLILISLFFCLSGSAADVGDGFYFDSQSKQYFASGKPKFSIRPISNSKYVEQIDVSLDGSDFRAFSKGISFTVEGAHTIRFRATDPVKNWSPIQTYRIFVDLSSPKSSTHWLGPKHEIGGKIYVHPNTKLYIVAQDNLSGVSSALVRENEKVTKHDIKAPIRQESTGTNSIEFAAIDNVGNQESWQKVSYIVDGESPETQLVLKGIHHRTEKNIFINRGTQVVMTSLDKLVGVDRIDYRINETSAMAYGNPFTLTDMINKVSYRAIDHIGNIEIWKEETIHMDTTSPKLNITESGNYVNFGGKVYAQPGFKLKVTAVDSESGLEGVYVKTKSSYEKTKKLEYTFSESGEHYFHIMAKDHVDNIVEGKPYYIFIDSEGPKTTLKPKIELVERDGVLLSPLPNVLEFSSTDESVGVDRIEASYDGTKFFKLDGSIDLATWKSATNDIYYRAVDRLGNKGETQKVTIRVLTQGPSVDLFVESSVGAEVALSELLTKERAEKKEREPAKQ